MLELIEPYLTKDFIQTGEGLCFAVVQNGTVCRNGKERVLCFLRYIKNESGDGNEWLKVSTGQANAYLQSNFPEYLYYSVELDAHLHAVETNRITQQYQPKIKLQSILQSSPGDKVEQDLFDLCMLFQQNEVDLSKAGVTGSLLIGAQQQASDIDLVFYDRKVFHNARTITAALIAKEQLACLSEKDWQESFARRSCAISFQEYVWHEIRKHNKALINGRKFDLNFVAEAVSTTAKNVKKHGKMIIQCKVIEDRYNFDYPALYSVEHETISSVSCYIATYTGQAFIGETVEVAGLLEQTQEGRQVIVVGSSREAPGEYLKVIKCDN
jgi:uncharacterized protein